MGIETRGWGQRSQDADWVPEMLGAGAMNSARPLLAARIRRLWEAGEFVAMRRDVAGSMAVRGRVVGLELAAAQTKS